MTREDVMRELMDTTLMVHKANLHKDFYEESWFKQVAEQAARLDDGYAIEFIRDQFNRRQLALENGPKV